MEITRETVEPMVDRVRLQIDHIDYFEEYRKKLKELAQTMDIKGFRKGKAPLGFVQKTQGRSILYEIVFEKINSSLVNFIKEEGLNYIFEPIPAEEQEAYTFEPAQKEDYLFSFDLFRGIDLDNLEGWSENNKYELLKVIVPKEEIDETFENLVKENGTVENVEEIVPESSTVVEFEIDVPIRDGDELQTFSHKLIWTEFTEEFQNELKGMKVGDTIEGSIEDFILEDFRKHIDERYLETLQLATEGEESEGEVEDQDLIPENFHKLEILWNIDEVSVKKPAELNEKFFDQFSTDKEKITNEEELRGVIEEELTKRYQNSARNVLLEDVKNRIIANNDPKIPTQFEEKFLGPEDAEKGLSDKERENAFWGVFITTLGKVNKVEVSEEEIKNAIGRQIMSYLGGNAQPQIYNMLLEQLSKDEKSQNRAFEDIFIEKTLTYLFDGVEKDEKEISAEEFKDILNERAPSDAVAEEE